MMYPYIQFADGTEVVHSQLIKEENNKEKVIVHFERPTEDGFDVARCELPEYKWTEKTGYSEEEMEEFVSFLHSNAHLIFKYANDGGIRIA